MPATSTTESTTLPGFQVGLDAEEMAAVRDAIERHIQALMREVAGTESHSLQHAIALNIRQLEAVARKLVAVQSAVQPS